MIVDDHAIVRQGLRAIFRVTPDLELVGEAGSGREAIEVLRSDGGFDVLVVDLMMPIVTGMDVYEATRVERPGPVSDSGTSRASIRRFRLTNR